MWIVRCRWNRRTAGKPCAMSWILALLDPAGNGAARRKASAAGKAARPVVKALRERLRFGLYPARVSDPLAVICAREHPPWGFRRKLDPQNRCTLSIRRGCRS